MLDESDAKVQRRLGRSSTSEREASGDNVKRVVNKEIPRKPAESGGSERKGRKERECQEACVGDHGVVGLGDGGKEQDEGAVEDGECGVYILGRTCSSANPRS